MDCVFLWNSCILIIDWQLKSMGMTSPDGQPLPDIW